MQNVKSSCIWNYLFVLDFNLVGQFVFRKMHYHHPFDSGVLTNIIFLLEPSFFPRKQGEPVFAVKPPQRIILSLNFLPSGRHAFFYYLHVFSLPFSYAFNYKCFCFHYCFFLIHPFQAPKSSQSALSRTRLSSTRLSHHELFHCLMASLSVFPNIQSRKLLQN